MTTEGHPDLQPSRFPQDPSEFDADHRISFSKLDNKFILETDEGQEYGYDDALKRWIPSVDDELLEQQRAAYAVKGVDENEPVEAKQRKRKPEYTNGEDFGAKKPKKAEKPPRERKNTAVYITNLPTDIDIDELQSTFSRCGVIAEEIDTKSPRIKIYTDEKTGAPKGDALIVYFRAESVALAVQMLDDTDFRLGEPASGGKMRVTAADFSYKQQKEAPQGGQKGGKDKKKIIKKTEKMNNKLADWDDDDPSTIQETSSRWDKVVILKHMFTLQELEEDAAAILDIKEDIREECSKLGAVTNVVLFDKEADGIASVRFAEDVAARECVRVMNGRYFGGQQCIAHIADGSEKFKRSSEKTNPLLAAQLDSKDTEEAEGGEGKRLDEFGAWLEGAGTVETGDARTKGIL